MLLSLATLAKAQGLFNWQSLQPGNLNLNMHQSLFQKKWLSVVTSGQWPTKGSSFSKHSTDCACHCLSHHQKWDMQSLLQDLAEVILNKVWS